MLARSENGKLSPLPKREGSLTQDYLKTILKYDPETGVWTWIAHYMSRYVGQKAGTNNKGYVYINIDGKMYLSHRLAFFYITGEWPKELVDHKDTDKLNNKWENLREATSSENNRNKKVTSRNSTGLKGVGKAKDGKFRVYLCLGTFDTKEEAKRVYDEAAKKLHGEFYVS